MKPKGIAEYKQYVTRMVESLVAQKFDLTPSLMADGCIARIGIPEAKWHVVSFAVVAINGPAQLTVWNGYS